MTDWECAECGVDTKTEYYMVHDHIWETFGREPLLCIGCLENKMGRTLWSGDFTHYAINNVNMFAKSDRLLNRLEATDWEYLIDA